MISTEKILEVGNRIALRLHIKAYIRPLYYRLYKSRLIEKQKAIFKAGAEEALYRFDECMRANNVSYTLAFGTLLGAVREGGFIKHDFDIDTLIWYDDYSEKIPNMLNEYGFKMIHTFLVEGGTLGREETYQYVNGVHIDIFYMYPAVDTYPYCCDFLQRDCLSFDACMKKYGNVLPRRIELPMNKDIMYIPFERGLLPVPKNAKEVLSNRYGKDYMIPNPKWGVQSHVSNIVEWNEVNAIYSKI